MTVGVGSICFACEHFRGSTCTAFPQGIPQAILFGGADHREPVGGEQTDDNGAPILFLLDDDRSEKLDAYEELKAILA